MPSSPLAVDASKVSFVILSAGSEIPETCEILDIRVDQHVNKIAEAEITVRDGNPADQTFEITDSATFKPGAEIEIKLGYQGSVDTIFKGVVTKQIIKVNNDSGSQLHVICKDKALASIINRKNAIFTDMKDSAIIEKLASAYGLQTDIASTSVTHKEIVQYYASDWDFIINRSEINGLVAVTDQGKLIVAKPAVTDTPALQIQYGYDILEFDGELDAATQLAGVDGNAWDMSTQSIINASASEPTVNEQGDLTGSTLSAVLSAGNNSLNASVPITQDDIQNWANSALIKSRLSRFKGSITFQGSAKAKVNSTLKIMGMSNRFNGNAYISGVTHILDNGQWHTEARIGLSSEWFIEKHPVSSPIASGLLPGVKGLQTGIVKKIYDDPENEFRVQVEIPILGAEGEFVWARLGTFYTGNGFGAFFMPEVDDEVILGFMNDDPRFPIILGSVFSSSIPTPETPDEKNSIKTILTQSKLQLKFDEENKVITLITPGENSIVISDEDEGITLTDQNNNKIQMNASGIVIDSASNLTLKAAESVTIQGASVTVKASESLSCSGGTVSITGNQTTSIAGSAECTISSDGQMSVKGAIVGIN